MKHQETMMEKLMKNQEMARQDQEAARKAKETPEHRCSDTWPSTRINQNQETKKIHNKFV